MSRARLLARIGLAAPAWSAVAALLVLVTTALLVAAPRAATAAAGVELREAVGAVQGAQRDLAAQAAGGFMPGEGTTSGLSPDAAEVYGALDEQLRALRDSADPLLRARLGEPDFVARTATVTAPAAVARPGVPISNVRIAFDPRIDERVELVAGTTPAAADGSVALDGSNGVDLPIIEVMMSAAASELLNWSLGEQRLSRELHSWLRLSGTFEAVDEEAAVWQHVPSVLSPEVFDDGNTAARAIATVYVAPGTLEREPQLMIAGSRLTTWFPFDASGLTLADAQSTVAELRRFTQAREALPALGGSSLRFSSGTLDALERVLARSDSTAALLVLVGSGPLGVVAAVLGLAALGVVTARRPTLELAAARGASPGALRRALAAEGALVGLPAAALGLLLALLLTPGDLGVGAVLVAASVGLAPIVVFAARASFPLRRADRRDLGSATRGRIRLVVDLLVTGLAVLSTVLLVTGGGTTASGVDVLAVAAPLLLATAGALLAERLLPAPTGAALARAARGPALAGFLGLARAVRDPAGSIAQLALIVALAIATGSTVLLSTLDRGTDVAAAGALGGDVRAEGPPVTEEQLDTFAALPGVAAVAGIEAIGTVTLSDGRERDNVTAYVVDGAALAHIQPGFPAGLDAGDEPIPFVASEALAAELSGEDTTIEGVRSELVGSAPGAGGIGAGAWLLVDRSASATIGAGSFTPRIVVASVEPGTDPRDVAEALRSALGDAATVSTLDERIAQQRSTPIPGTLRAGFAAAIGMSAALALAALLMSSRLAAPRRAPLARTLRRLGASRREIVGVFATEALPATVAALVVGAALGVAIPFLVVAAVDLAPIVGGIAPPALVLDPLALAALVLGALAAAAASLAPVLVSSRKETE